MPYPRYISYIPPDSAFTKYIEHLPNSCIILSKGTVWRDITDITRYLGWDITQERYDNIPMCYLGNGAIKEMPAHLRHKMKEVWKCVWVHIPS